jgi:hypothetical protein
MGVSVKHATGSMVGADWSRDMNKAPEIATRSKILSGS